MWSENTRRRLKRINTWDNKEFLPSNFSHQTQFQVAQKAPSKINAPSPNQFSSVPQSCPTLGHPMDCSTPSFPVHHQHPELAQFMSTESAMPSNHLILCHPLLLLPSTVVSIRTFSNELVLHIRWPKYWNFSFSISPSNEYSGLISFMFDYFDLSAVQETHKSLLHHSSKASVLQCSAFFMVQLSHPYMTTGKTITWTKWTFVGKVMSLVFNVLHTNWRKSNFKKSWKKQEGKN